METFNIYKPDIWRRCGTRNYIRGLSQYVARVQGGEGGTWEWV